MLVLLHDLKSLLQHQAIATGIAQMTTAVIASVDHGTAAAARLDTCRAAGLRAHNAVISHGERCEPVHNMDSD